MKTAKARILCAVLLIAAVGCSPEVSQPTVNTQNQPSKSEDGVAKQATTSPEVEKPATPISKQRDAIVKTPINMGLAEPVRLEAEGEPIDIGKLSGIAHAGPWIADVDCDGDRDLLVGDFPGYFWMFENTNDDEQPKYVSRGKLQAGGEDAKTPVY